MHVYLLLKKRQVLIRLDVLKSYLYIVYIRYKQHECHQRTTDLMAEIPLLHTIGRGSTLVQATFNI
jgi:hypothetical protein